MTALVYILLISMALFAVIGVMIVVMQEKRPHDAHLHYRRSPWDEGPVAPPRTENHHDATTVAEAPDEPVSVEEAAHAPVTEDGETGESSAERP